MNKIGEENIKYLEEQEQEIIKNAVRNEKNKDILHTIPRSYASIPLSGTVLKSGMVYDGNVIGAKESITEILGSKIRI